MRIISGKYGKRRFELPKNFRGRPTTEVAKEALFNILQNRIDWEETRFLDLFAGSGSIGLEALSRGAKEVLAIEKNPRHTSFINSVVEQLSDDQYSVQTRDVFAFIENSESFGTFELIFADPPYDLPLLAELPSRIMSSQLLSPEGCLVVEHPKEYDFSNEGHFVEMRRYGTVHFSFFALNSNHNT